MRQLLAITACDAWIKGMQPAGESYADLEFMRCLDEIMKREE